MRGITTSGREDETDDHDELDDVRKMGRVWVKERGTVDIMPWEGDLIDTLFDKLEQQVSTHLLNSEKDTSSVYWDELDLAGPSHRDPKGRGWTRTESTSI